MDSAKDLPSLLPPSTSVSAHRSCTRCARRMSSIKYDRHSVCLHCRDVHCSLEVRCSSAALGHQTLYRIILNIKKTLVSKGKKQVLSAPSYPLVTPAVSTSESVVSSPSLPSVSDETSLGIMCTCFYHHISHR